MKKIELVKKYIIQKNREFLEEVDRTISGGILTQLKWLILAIIGALVFFIIIAICIDSPIFKERSIVGKMQGVIYHFFDSGNLNTEREQGFWMQLFTLIISFMGMVLLSGLLITTFSNIIERRVDGVKRGLTVYKGIKNHYVIIGYGEVSNCLIDDLIKINGWDDAIVDEKERKKRASMLPKIIIFTGLDIETVRSEIYSQIPKEVESRIYLYAGNIESMEHLANLNIEYAKEVYVLGDCNQYGRDSKNLAAVKNLAKLRGTMKIVGKEVLDVHVQFDRMPSYSIIQKLSIPESYISYDQNELTTPNIYFRPFNFYENWSRLLWSYYALPGYQPLDFELMKGEKHVHLVIVGFNRMGRALLLEALRICHYPNFDLNNEKTKTRITMIDKEMDSQLAIFKSQYPYIDSQICDIEVEYVNGEIENETNRARIAEWAKDDDTLLTIAICLKDPDLSLATGLSLPESVYYLSDKIEGDKNMVRKNDIRTQVLIRQELQHGLGEILDQDNERFKNVKVFGMLTNGLSTQLLNDDMPIFVNENYKLLYEKKCSLQERYEDGLEELKKSDARENWIKLSENLRWANRYQIDIFGSYMLILANEGITQIDDLKLMTKPLLEAMSKTELRRWIAERTVSGWRQ